MPRQQIYDMPFGKVYDCLIAKAERKGRTKDEVDELTKWLTGYLQLTKLTRLTRLTRLDHSIERSLTCHF